jgi:hypothetical protein
MQEQNWRFKVAETLPYLKLIVNQQKFGDPGRFPPLCAVPHEDAGSLTGDPSYPRHDEVQA